MPNNSLILYHTDGCHLCDLAQALLIEHKLPFELIDIIDDEALVKRYGEKIPVLKSSSGAELNWPFDSEQLQQFTEVDQ